MNSFTYGLGLGWFVLVVASSLWVVCVSSPTFFTEFWKTNRYEVRWRWSANRGGRIRRRSTFGTFWGFCLVWLNSLSVQTLGNQNLKGNYIHCGQIKRSLFVIIIFYWHGCYNLGSLVLFSKILWKIKYNFSQWRI